MPKVRRTKIPADLPPNIEPRVLPLCGPANLTRTDLSLFWGISGFIPLGACSPDGCVHFARDLSVDLTMLPPSLPVVLPANHPIDATDILYGVCNPVGLAVAN